MSDQKTWPVAGIEVSNSYEFVRVVRARWLEGEGDDRHAGLEVLSLPNRPSDVEQLLRGWLLEHGTHTWVIDPRSPSASLAAALPRCTDPGAAGVAEAHGMFTRAVQTGRLRFADKTGLLREHMKVASSRRLAGSLAPDRHAGPDISALCAAELAYWQLPNDYDVLYSIY